MAKTTCQNCERTVVVVGIGDRMVMLDTELIAVIPVVRHRTSSGGPVMSTNPTTVYARRLHAELCDTYREQAQRAKLAAEQRAYNRKHGRGGIGANDRSQEGPWSMISMVINFARQLEVELRDRADLLASANPDLGHERMVVAMVLREIAHAVNTAVRKVFLA